MIRFWLLIGCLFYYAAGFSQAFKIDQFTESEQFKKSKFKIITQIQIVGNKTTKNHIISREVPFEVGDTLTNAELSTKILQAKKNILNTSLFNFVKLDVALLNNNSTVIVVQVTERLYIFPLPIFEIDDNNFNTWWKDKDFSRINYGMHVSHKNFRGRKEKLSITAKYGFTERYKIKYSIPYLNRNQKSGLTFSFSYNRKDEVAYNTFDNERQQFKDENQNALKNYSSNISYQYRKAIYNTHSFGIEHDYNTIVDSIRLLNPNYLGKNRKDLSYISLFYQITNDKRDSRTYPLNGRFLKASIRKQGIGISNKSIDLTTFRVEAKKYFDLSKRFYLASSFTGLFAVNDNQPYLLRNGIGYSNFGIRSYEYYVIDGNSIGLAKMQLRYQLVKPQSANLGGITDKLGKFHYAFYLGLFTDAAYVQDKIGYPKNDLANQIQFGSGIGLDFVSYYDIVIRTEYSINKFGESGIFFHFVAPI